MNDHREDGLKDYTDGYFWGGSLGTFGIPEDVPRSETEEIDHQWSAVISSGGRSVEYSWGRRLSGGRIHGGYSARVYPLEGFGENVYDGSAELVPFEGAAQALRRRELSLEFDSAALLDDPELLRKTVLELFERAYGGEFLGQSGSTELLSVEEVAEILWINPQLILRACQALVADGKLVREEV